MSNILSAEGFTQFECECGEYPFGETHMMDICGEPFNGICTECKCGKEYSIDLGFRVSIL